MLDKKLEESTIQSMAKVPKHQLIFVVALYALAFAFPITEALKQISVVSIFLLGVYLFVKKELFFSKDLSSYSAIALVLTSLVSVLFAFDQKEALNACIDIFRIMVLFLILKNISLSPAVILRFTQILYVSMLLTLIYGLYQMSVSDEFIHLKLNSIGHVNHSSLYLLLIFCLSLSWYFIQDEVFQITDKKLTLIIIFSTLIGIFISGSRATMYTSVMLLLLIFFLSKAFKEPKYYMIIAGTFLCVGLVLLNNDYVMTKMNLVLTDSPRVELYISSILAWWDHNIFFGIGADNSHFINPQNYVDTGIFTKIVHSHNTYLNYLLERGLLGLGVYLFFMFALLYELIKRYRESANRLIVAALLVWLVNFIISFVNTTFHDENALLMAIIWGMALNKSSLKERL